MVLLLSPHVSLAGGPAAQNSTVPASITLVGSFAGTPDATGMFTVVARDPANNPLNGASIVLDLSGCTDLSICADQMDAFTSVNCAAKTVRKFTNLTGSVTFIVLGGSSGAGSASTMLGGARIYGNGTLLGSPTVASLDLDGVHGVAINDLSVWLSDFASGTPFGRSDFDGSGAVDINDLSVWLTAYGAAGSTQGCTASCP
jgi:hypothetical protein